MAMAKKPEKSSFSHTCSLLSQYIKKRGSFVDLGMGLPSHVLDSSSLGKPENYRPPTTLSLLPGDVVSGDNCDGMMEDSSSLSDKKSMELFPQHAGFCPISPPEGAKEPEKAQLTIFYGGKVLVFDNFPADKASDLIQIASKGQNFTAGTASSQNSYAGVTPAVDLHTFPSAANRPAIFPAQTGPNFSDLPIARKASLHRFLQKRRDRISAQAPYQLNSCNDIKDRVTVEEEISTLKPGLNSNYRSLIYRLCD